MSSKILDNLKYTKDHEWALLEGDVLTVGVTDFAQSSLGDIVFIELPQEGSAVSKGVACGVIESIKSVSDLYSPASGKIFASNKDIEAKPESCNADPYGSWLFKSKISNPSELNELMNAAQYQAHCDAGH